MKKYVPNLIKRQKWCEKHRNLQIGDLVMIVDNKNPLKSWPMGAIVAVHSKHFFNRVSMKFINLR
jgi:Family of unknown function (DUF5641)